MGSWKLVEFMRIFGPNVGILYSSWAEYRPSIRFGSRDHYMDPAGKIYRSFKAAW